MNIQAVVIPPAATPTGPRILELQDSTMKTKSSIARPFHHAVIVVSFSVMVNSAFATNGTWVGNGNGTNTGNYSDTTQWTGGTVAMGTDATATVNLNGTTGSGATTLLINTAVTLGTLQLANSSGANFGITGSSTTLTFDVTTGTPLLAVNSWYGKVYAIGTGGLTIAGIDGLKVETGSNTVRPSSGLSWTGFSGTLEISSNGGTGGWDPQAAGLMPSVNVKLAQEAGNIDFGMFGGRNQTIGGLDGTVRAFFRNNSTTVASTLTVGANDGNGTFAGTVGMTADGLTVNGGINIVKTGAGTQEFSGPILKGTATGVTTVPTVTASGGTLVLSGNNTYNGMSTVNSGAILKIAHVNALGASGSNTEITKVNSGGVLDLNGQTIAEQFGDTGSNDGFAGTGIGGAGALINSSGTAAEITGIIYGNQDWSVGGTGDIKLGTVTRRNNLNPTLTKVGAGTLTLAGTADNSYISLIANEGTVVLAKNATATIRAAVDVTIGGGTVKFDPASGTVTGGNVWGGQINGTVTLNSGTLDLNGSSGQNSRIQQLIGTGGIVTNSSSTAATLEIAARDTNLTRQFDGIIQNGVGTVALNIQTAGTLNYGRVNFLTGDNSYTGGTTNARDTLKLGHDNALGLGTVANSATIDLNGHSLANVLVNNGNGGVWTNSSATTATVSEGFNKAGAGSFVISDFTVNGTGDINWPGAIRRTNFVGTITKNGGNTLTLNGAGSNYTNMNYTVSGGTLAINLASGNFTSGTITVNSGGFLGFTLGVTTTSTNSVTLNTGAKIKVTGTPTLPSYTLITASSITGTPELDTPIPGYALVLDGNSIKLNTSSGFATWAVTNGALGQSASDDHDGDGVSNGVEYFIGGPTGNTTGFTALPGVTTVGGVHSITWTHAAGYTGTYGTDFFVETSTTLAAGSWNTESADAGGTVTISGNDVTYTFPAGPVERFVRLKVISN